MIERDTGPDGSALTMMWWINTSVRLILMGKLVPYFMKYQIISFLTTTDIILSPWEGRELLKSKIKIGIFPISNGDVNEMKREQLHADILQRRINGNNSTVEKTLKDFLKVAM